MKAGQETKMLRGAIWACAIPVGIGLIGLGLLVYDLMYFLQKQYLVRTHHFVTRPIVACFILGTPLAAWIACLRLRKIESAVKLGRWRSSAGAGLIGSTVTHFIAVILYSLCVALFVDMTGGGYNMSARDDGFVEIVFSFLAGNLIPWLFITLPLSLLCATIFWQVTKFPEEKAT